MINNTQRSTNQYTGIKKILQVSKNKHPYTHIHNLYTYDHNHKMYLLRKEIYKKTRCHLGGNVYRNISNLHDAQPFGSLSSLNK